MLASDVRNANDDVASFRLSAVDEARSMISSPSNRNNGGPG